MSTKTSFKRIAAVAAVALTLGGFSAVSAFASDNVATSITANAVAPARATVQTAINLTLGGTYVASTTTQDLGAIITTAPTGSATAAMTFETLPTAAGTPKAYANERATGTYGSVNATASTTDTGTAYATITAGNSTTAVKTNLLFTPDVAGTYTILIFGNGTSYAAGLISTSVTITTAGTPASATLTSLSGSSFAKTAAATTTGGALLALTLKDAAGLPTVPTSYESIDLSQTGAATATTVGIGGTAQSAGSKKSYTSTDFKYGVKAFNVANTVAETFVINVAGSGLAAGLSTAALSLASKTVYTQDAADLIQPDPTVATAAKTGGFTVATVAAGNSYTTATNLTSIPLVMYPHADLTSTSTAVFGYKVVDTSGTVTGYVGATYYGSVAGTTADLATTAESITISTAGLSSTKSFTIENLQGTVASASHPTIVTGATAAADVVGSVSPTVLRNPVGAGVSIRAKVINQFGNAVANTPVSASIAGRNAATTISGNLITDSTGYVTFTYTDAGTATSSLTSDTVTFTCSTCATTTTATASAIFSAQTASTITLTGGNVSAGVTSATAKVQAISAGDGAEAGKIAITATVKDANGNLLSGVPVTFSVAGSGVAVPTASVVAYTSSTGVASSFVYAWLAGTYTYTATAGTATASGTITFADTTAANARTISAAVAGNIVTATVKDRFGNPVSGSTVYIKTTGGANVGGAFQTSGTTLTDGTISWVVSGSGTATVYSNLNPSAVAGTNPSDQSCALAGNLTCASGATAAVAFTASTVGTTTTAETGVGASIAPAGVNSASVTVSGSDQAGIDAAQAAQDAANEATDAANAATDAANNAMDSADAAQQAAMDAGDKADAALAAVTDLATKVSEIASQISSLSAVVAKIAAAVAKISAKVKA